MASTFSFDVVSEVNFMEVENAINQAQKELAKDLTLKAQNLQLITTKPTKK